MYTAIFKAMLFTITRKWKNEFIDQSMSKENMVYT